MEAFNIGNQFNLYWKKIIICCLLLFSGLDNFAQQLNNQGWNLPNYDNRLLHYGFQLGLNYSQFRIKHSDNFLEQDTVQSVYGIGSGAFTLGFILNVRLGEYFDGRVLPTVSFYQRQLNYHLKDGKETINIIFSSSFIELPLLIKYKSSRRKNTRMYMIGGVKPGMTVGSKKEDKDLIKSATFDLSVDVGLGMDIYYPLFKFAPEVRFSVGLLNMLGKSDEKTIYSENLETLNTYTVTLFFLFE